MSNVTDSLRSLFQQAKQALLEAQSVCIISHRGPDGDAVGANLALRHVLEGLGKEVTSACVDPVPSDSMFLPKADQYVSDFDYEAFDVIVSVDCGALKLVKFHETKPELLSGNKPFINFDHHGSNDNFGTINVVEPDACATCYILHQFFEFCGWPVTITVANCLLCGVYFDTGGLMHSNSSANVFRMAGDLVRKGADSKRIAKELFHTTPVNKMRLWGKIMERAYVNEDGVTVSAVGAADYDAAGAGPNDTGGAIDYLNSVPDSQYCVLLSEGENGIVKGSLRTRRDDVNLSDVASQWGGGGHPKASGFGLPGHLKQVVSWKVEGGEGGDKKLEF